MWCWYDLLLANVVRRMLGCPRRCELPIIVRAECFVVFASSRENYMARTLFGKLIRDGHDVAFDANVLSFQAVLKP